MLKKSLQWSRKDQLPWLHKFNEILCNQKKNLVLTFSNEVPPCRIKRIIWAPASDILTIRFTSVIFVNECRSVLDLGIERREGTDIGFPPRKGKYKLRYLLTCLSLVCNERVCIQYVEGLQQLSLINMFISLATKTYRRVHFVDSEARVEVGERRYGGTHLKRLIKCDGECVWKDTYPGSSQSSVSCNHTCIIVIEYLMPRIKSNIRSQKVGHVRWTGLHECCKQLGEKFLWNRLIDHALAEEDVYVQWDNQNVYIIQMSLGSLAITWGEYRSTLE